MTIFLQLTVLLELVGLGVLSNVKNIGGPVGGILRFLAVYEIQLCIPLRIAIWSL